MDILIKPPFGAFTNLLCYKLDESIIILRMSGLFIFCLVVLIGSSVNFIPKV